MAKEYVVIERWKLKQLYECSGHAAKADELVEFNTIPARKLWDAGVDYVLDLMKGSRVSCSPLNDFLTTKFNDRWT